MPDSTAKLWPAANSKSKKVGPKQAFLPPARAEAADVIPAVVAAAAETGEAVAAVAAVAVSAVAVAVAAVEVEDAGNKDYTPRGAFAIS